MPLSCLLPEASLTDVISETRRASAERGANHAGEEGHGEEGHGEEGHGEEGHGEEGHGEEGHGEEGHGEEGHGEEGHGEEGHGSSFVSVRKDAARRAATPSRRTSTLTAPGRSGDLIVIDSPQVGSPPREGKVLEVIHGEVSVSYRVRWADGLETLIAPKSGSARIVPASTRA